LAPTVRFWWNLIFELLSKTCQENSSYVKIWQECFYIYDNILLNSSWNDMF
jgi:hypothetical protein